MNLLIAILMWLGLYATPDLLTNPQFYERNRDIINYSNTCIENSWYKLNESGVVVDVGVGV